MKLIDVSNGRFKAMVDDLDYDGLIKHKWYAAPSKDKFGVISTRYAQTTIGKKSIGMHRMILGLSNGDTKKVDHKDHDGLNNQRDNIRLCEHYQNMQNRKKHRGTSKYFGVSLHVTHLKRWSKKQGKMVTYSSARWWAKIVVDKKQISLGRFDNEFDAAKCYDEAAKKYHGEFANINFKEEPNQLIQTDMNERPRKSMQEKVAIISEIENPSAKQVIELAKKHGINPATYYAWMRKFKAGIPEGNQLLDTNPTMQRLIEQHNEIMALKEENKKLKEKYLELVLKS